MTRRELLLRLIQASVAGLAVGGRWSTVQARVRPTAQTFALSLERLQTLCREAVQGGGALPPRLRHLCRINRVTGFVTLPSGELVLLGVRADGEPRLDVDDLAVALRNGFQVSRDYAGVLGCTIDPIYEHADPWRLQKVAVFATPSSRMAALFVDCDYAMKAAGAGVSPIADVTGVPARWQRLDPCRASVPDAAREPHEQQHRFWFTAKLPPAPRYVAAGTTTKITTPVAVQVLTERELRTPTGARTGSAPANAAAEDFAHDMTALLERARRGEAPDRWVRLVQAFRLIELAQLLRHRAVSPHVLQYLLHEHALAPQQIPEYVGGVGQDLSEQTVCATKIKIAPERDGRRKIQSSQDVRQRQLDYRGGVEAAVAVTPADVVAGEPSEFEAFTSHVAASRRPAALCWRVSA
jgi:hypothetical protein